MITRRTILEHLLLIELLNPWWIIVIKYFDVKMQQL